MTDVDQRFWVDGQIFPKVSNSQRVRFQKALTHTKTHTHIPIGEDVKVQQAAKVRPRAVVGAPVVEKHIVFLSVVGSRDGLIN